MTLKELLENLLGDYTYIKVFSEEEQEVPVTEYNGRDNIDHDYDDCHINSIWAENTPFSGVYLCAEINLDDERKVDRLKLRRRGFVCELEADEQEIIFGALCINLARLFPDKSWQQVYEDAQRGMCGRVADLEDIINLNELGF